MAALAHGDADSAVPDQRDYDRAGIVRADAGAEKSCHGLELGALSRCARIGAALRRESFLPGMPVHVGTQRGAAIF